MDMRWSRREIFVSDVTKELRASLLFGDGETPFPERTSTHRTKETLVMSIRIIAIALAASTLALTAAQAQTGSTTGTGSTTTTTPGMSGSTGSSTGTMGSGSSGSAGSGQIAQQPGGFKASDYKTKAECLTAAKAANASSTACSSLY
jgi:hypothetical protein